MNEQTLMIESLIAEALEAGVTLYEKNGGLAFKQKQGFPEDLKARVVANKADIIEYFQKQHFTNTKNKISQVERLEKVPRQVPIPLSFAQEGLWFIEQLQGSKQYYMPAEFKLQGKLNVAGFEYAISKVIERHEILRTNFVEDETGLPHQVISESIATPFTWHDISELEESDKLAFSNKLKQTYFDEPFDLSTGALLRVLLVSDNEQHWLAFNMHHIISDGASLACLVGEIVAFYSAFLTGEQRLTLPKLELQYADYANWQRENFTPQRLQQISAFWQEKLADIEPIQSLPCDRARPAVQKLQGQIFRQQLSSLSISNLQTQASKSGVTPFMWVLSCFMLFIGRISQSDSVAVGTPVLGRSQPELADLIGLFVNTLVVHGQLHDELPFNEWLKIQKETILQAFEYREMPFDKLVEGLKCERDLSHHPLVQILFTLEQNQDRAFNLPGVVVEPIVSSSTQSCAIKCDLELNVQLNQEGATLNWKFDSALYDLETIQNWANSFEVMLSHTLINSDTPCAKLPLLNDQQRHELLLKSSAKRAQWPQNETLVSLFDKVCKKYPDNIALTDGQSQLTYSQLALKVDNLAYTLAQQGVKPGLCIPISVSRTNELVVSLLATIKVGAAYVPIDPQYPLERINYIVKDIDSDFLICDQSCAVEFSSLAEKVINIDDLEYDKNFQNVTPDVGVRPEDLAYIIYTSGTTGQPKGVQIEHRHVVRLLFTEPSLFDFSSSDIWTLFHSFCFDFSVWEMYGALLFGGKLVVINQETSKDSQAFAQCLLDNQVTVLNQTPSAFYVLQQSLLAMPEESLSDCHIRYVIFGGEALSPSKIKPWSQQFTRCQLINMYGITETTVHVTYKKITQQEIERGTSNIGKPIPTTFCYVLDKEQQLLPVGAIGELYVGGEGVCRGYWQREGLNQTRFIEDTYSHDAGKKLYKSGDLVRYLPNGELVYIGRADDQVKVRGYRIELGEIENQLRTHPWLDEVAVLLDKTHHTGARICAFAVVNKQAQFDSLSSQLKQYLRLTLPEFMLPSGFVAVDTIPLTHNGKVNKKALLALDIDEDEKEQFCPPRSPVEQIIAECFEQVLQVSKVGREGHFFRLGGHSLLATQLVTHLRERAKLNISLKDLFQQPQVKSLALYAQQNNDSAELVTQIPIVSKDQPLPLSFAQQRLWSIDQIQQGSLEYHMSAAFDIKGRLNVDAFTQAWNAIVMRHEVLRTNIRSLSNGEPHQVISDLPLNPVQYVDASALNEVQKQRLWLKVLRDDGQTPFDLEQDLMLRVVLVKESREAYKLLINTHHIASDAKSLDILVKEFTHYYQCFAHEQALPEFLREPLAIQYADYASWQRDSLAGKRLESDNLFWLKHLKGAPPIHQLPLDNPRTKQLKTNGDVHVQYFDEILTSQLRAHCQRLDITTFTWLHSAFSLLVARLSQTHDVVIGSPFSGREHSQLDALIGFFVNTLPIRTQFSDSMSFEALLLQQKAVLQEIHLHHAMPFEQIVESLGLNRDLSHQSVFQLSFSLNPDLDTELHLPSITINAQQASATKVKFDIELSCSKQDKGLRFSWAYNTSLFERKTIETLSLAFEVLVKQVLNRPQQAVGSIPLTDEAHTNEYAICGKQTGLPEFCSVVEYIEELANAADSRTLVAVKEPCSGQEINYQRLHNRSDELAKYLVLKGLVFEERVLISMHSGIDLVVAMLAVMKAGGCYVPVDPNYPLSRVEHIVQDSGAKWLISQTEYVDKLIGTCPDRDYFLCIDDYQHETRILEATRNFVQLPSIRADQLAYVLYTSGTTGKPKGVMIPHQGLVNLCSWHKRAFEVTEQSVATQTANIAFDAATWEIWPYLSVGASVVSISKAQQNDPEQLSSLLSHYKVTHCFLATPIAEVVLSDDSFTPEFLKYLLVGGDKLGPLNSHQFPFSVVNNYGPTETSVVATSGIVESTPEETPDIGLPIDNTELFILDNHRQLTPLGMIGELYIAGRGLARGYLNNIHLSEERFVTLNLANKRPVRAYKTGDLVRRLHNGRIAYIARNDSQIKLRGYRIELSEIEHVLTQVSEVQECVVQIFTRGNTNSLVAFVTTDLREDKASLPEKLAKVANGSLPRYMCPTHYYVLDEIPLTPHGKIDAQALTEFAQDQKRTSCEFESPKQSEQPSGGFSNQLLTIYRDVLNMPKFGLHDDFFACGGDSILSIQIASRARAAGLELKVVDIFNHASVYQLLENVTPLTTATGAFTDESPFIGSIAPLPIQKWFFEQSFEQPSHWNQALLLSIDKKVTSDDVELAWRALIEQHDSLRLVVKEQNTDVVLEVLPSSHYDCDVQHQDLSLEINWPDTFARLADQLQASFCFDGSSLTRLCLAKTPEGESKNRLLLVVHHLLIDGVSWRILLEDLQQSLYQLTHHLPSQLPKRSANIESVGNFFKQLATDETNLARWQSLAKVSRETHLFANKKMSHSDGDGLRKARFTCSKQLTQNLLTQGSVKFSVDLQVSLLAALQWCLYRHYQTNSQVVMLEGHGRELLGNNLDCTRTTGWLTSLYPAHLYCNTDDISLLVCDIKEQVAQLSAIASSYGALRYNHTSADVQTSLSIDTQDKIFFNYLGQLDGSLQNADLLSDAPEHIGTLHSKANHLYYAVQMTAAISNECLSVTIDYDNNNFTDDEISQFVALLEQSIEDIERTYLATDLKVFTPSDFKLLEGVSNLQIQGLLEPLRGMQIEDIYPLSALQQGMWLHSQTSISEQTPYVEQTAMMFSGNFDIEAFCFAWEQVIAEHSILRTAFIKASPEPLQVVFEKPSIPLSISDERFVLSEEEALRYLHEQSQKEYNQGVQLGTAPAMRLCLIPFSNEHCGFIWTYHHMILDGWSIPILLSKLLGHYKARIEGIRTSHKVDRFSDYIGYLKETSNNQAQDFWQTYLKGVDEPTLLSAAIANQAKGKQGTLEELQLTLTSQFNSKVNEFAKQHSITVNHLVQSVWAYWISVCCNTPYALFGQTVSGRPTDLNAVETRVGMYINTQPVRINIPHNSSVFDFLQAVKQNSAGLNQHVHSVLTDVHTWSDIPNGTELFDALYVFENFPTDPLNNVEQLPFDVIYQASQDNTHYPISLVVGCGDSLSLTLCYNTALFSDQLAHDALGTLQHLLEAFISSPNTLLCQIPLRGDGDITPDKSLFLQEFRLYGAQGKRSVSQTFKDTLQQQFEFIAQQYATQDALMYYHSDGVLSMSYEELNIRANQLAHFLSQRLTLTKNTQPIIGVCLGSGFELIVAILASLKLGAAYLPISPSLPLQRRRFMLENAKASALITSQNEKAEFAMTQVIDLHKSKALLAHMPKTQLNLPYHRDDLCYVIYTSGTTGTPKGVMVEQQSVVNYVEFLTQNYAISSSDNYLQFASCSFDVFAEEVFCTLLSGATLVMSEQSELLNTESLGALSRECEISLMSLPTAYWHQLCNIRVDLSNKLRLITIGGEAMQSSALSAWQRNYDANIRLINAYGPTEATISATLNDVTTYEGELVPIGQPVANVNLHVLDGHQRALPNYIAGQLYISGVALARGYLHDEQRTLQSFIIDEQTNKRLYKTGDKVRVTVNGEIEYIGRVDKQVKIRGYRIELGEVEKCILSCEHVQRCSVIVHEDTSKTNQLYAFVVSSSQHLQEDMIKTQLSSELPDYMVPSKLWLIDELPITVNGKVDQTKLLERVLHDTVNATSHAPPQTPVQIAIAEHISCLLNVELPSIDDDIFNLGMHSLLMMRLLGEISRQIGISLPVELLFKNRTIRSLSKVIEQIQQKRNRDSMGNAPATLVCLQAGQKGYTPIVLVAGAGGLLISFQALLERLDERIPVYGLQPDEIAHDDDLISSLSATAKHYVSALNKLKLNDRVSLVGHSFGSFIVHEMACQLKQDQASAVSMYVLDTPVSVQNVTQVHRDQSDLYLLNNLCDFFSLKAEQSELNAYIKLPITHRSAWLSNYLSNQGYYFSEPQLESFSKVFHAQLNADIGLQKCALNFPVKVIKANETRVFEGAELAADMGWAQLHENLKCYEIDANHFSMLQSDHVGQIVNILENNYVLD